MERLTIDVIRRYYPRFRFDTDEVPGLYYSGLFILHAGRNGALRTITLDCQRLNRPREKYHFMGHFCCSGTLSCHPVWN